MGARRRRVEAAERVGRAMRAEAGGGRDVRGGGGEDERGRGAGGEEAAEGELVEAEGYVGPMAAEEEDGGSGGRGEGIGELEGSELGPLGLGAVGGERGSGSGRVRVGGVAEGRGGRVGGGISARRGGAAAPPPLPLPGLRFAGLYHDGRDGR